MNQFLENLYEKAISLNKHIVLAEGFDKRVVKAAELVTAKKLARVTVLGDPEKIKAENPDVNLEGVNIVDFTKSEKIEVYAEKLYELRKLKGMTI